MTVGSAPLSTSPFSTVILAAGIGKRMYSRKTKVLHEILGKPIVQFVVDTAIHAGSNEVIVVVGKNAQEIKKALGRTLVYALQPVPLGTGDAALEGIKKAKYDNILVLNGDIPLLQSSTIQELIALHKREKSGLSFLSCRVQNPFGYGRILRYKKKINGIVEHSDATTRQQAIKEINVGVYYGNKALFIDTLKTIHTQNAQGELYLPDIIPGLIKKNIHIAALQITDEDEIQGINTNAQLAQVRSLIKERWLRTLMEQGVAIEDPLTTTIDLTVKIGKFVRIRPFTLIEGNSRIKDRTTIGPFVWIKDGIQRTFIKDA